MIRTYVGLGSNLDDPAQHLRIAITELQKLPKTQFIRASSLYCTPPLGPQNQPDFINAVVALDTELAALDLLLQLLAIENQHSRVRDIAWGPRTLDLDLLLYGDQQIDHPQLKIPHPGIKTREFVLYPLREIAPDLVLPGGESVQELLPQCSRIAVKLP